MTHNPDGHLIREQKIIRETIRMNMRNMWNSGLRYSTNFITIFLIIREMTNNPRDAGQGLQGHTGLQVAGCRKQPLQLACVAGCLSHSASSSVPWAAGSQPGEAAASPCCFSPRAFSRGVEDSSMVDLQCLLLLHCPGGKWPSFLPLICCQYTLPDAELSTGS